MFEWRSADGDYKKVPGLAADLVRRKVDVIVVDTTPATRAVKRTTSTIPIVMATVGDPVGSGLVASLAHPGGNVTGLSMMATEVSVKKLQLLKEAIPRVARVSVLWNPDNPSHSEAIEELKAVAPSLSIELRFVSARTRPRIGIAHHAADGVNAYGLVVGRLAAHEQRSVLGLRPFVADIGFQRFAGHRGQRLDVLTA